MANVLLIACDPATIALLNADPVYQRLIVDTAIESEIDVESITASQYDLIVWDTVTASQQSLRVCRQLREQGDQTLILLLATAERAAIAGLDAGADDAVIKPYNPPELLARVRALLRRGNSTLTTALAASLLTWEQLSLNPTAAEVVYNGQPLSLTPKEYGLLELFLQHPQRIFSRTTIIDRLWMMNDLPTEQAVTNHIKALRHKLRSAGMTTDLIETVYGLGYRLKAAPVSPLLLKPEPESGAAPAIDPATIVSAAINPALDMQASDTSAAIVPVPDTSAAIDPVAIVPLVNATAGALPSATVLVLDSDPTTRAALSYLLQPWGIHVVCLSQPDRLWETLSSVTPDLLILDIELPFDRGTELCQQIRQDDQWGNVPILVVTAFTNANRVKQMFAVGVDDFMGKPIVEPELVTRVVSRLERVHAQRTEPKPSVEPSRPTAASPKNVALHTNANLVLVDDQPDNLRTLAAILNGQGYKVRKSISGEAALETIHAQRPDLILLDIRMPLMDGYAVCAVLKAAEDTRDIPIIFLSALDAAADKLKAFAAGGADYIIKPFQSEEVLARIKHQLIIRQQQRQLLEQNRQLQREIQQRQLSEWSLSQASAVLQESEERFRQAFDRAAIAMALVGLDDRWLKVNPTLCHLLGYSETELLSLTVAAIVQPVDRQLLTQCYQAMLTGDSNMGQTALTVCRKAGHPLFAQVSASLVRNVSGEPLYAIVQFQIL